MSIYQSQIILIIISLVLIAGCTGNHDSASDPEKTKTIISNDSMRMSVSSTVNGSTLPTLYTCNGPGQVPAIFWKNPPDKSQSMVLIMDDPDAPGGVFTHWIVYNLSPGAGGIPPNQLPVSERAGTGIQGINSMKTRGYAPPCPPGSQVHRYVFTLYALDTQIYPEILDRTYIEAAMQGHIIEQVRIVTFYNREI